MRIEQHNRDAIDTLTAFSANMGCPSKGASVDGLTPEQQARLTQLLEYYISRMEAGQRIDGDETLAIDPDLVEPLREHLDRLVFFQDAAAGLRAVEDPIGPSGDLLERPRVLGDFEILREVGRGGMGVVYEARQISLSRRVALKVLPFASLLDPQQIVRFQNEAQAAAQLDDPHIVPVYSVGSDRGVHYYAMQFIDGQPLSQVIQNLDQARRKKRTATIPNGRRSASEPGDSLSGHYTGREVGYFQKVARLGIQAAEALQSAHELGIVHRDIKPSNLLLDPNGELWITDFGLARCRSHPELTKSGEFIGTLRYMSPEQARGGGAVVDHRTDIYSLGVTLYELLALRHPVRGYEPAEILRQLEHDHPYRIRLWNRHVPVDLENIVQKAMSKTVEERYPCAQQLADDLRRFLDGRPTIARRPTMTLRAIKWVRRHRLVTSFMAVLLTMVLCLIGATAMLFSQQRSTEAALARAEQHHLQYQTQLALAKSHLALLQDRAGLPGQAETLLVEAIRLQRDVLRRRPEDEEILERLGAALGNLSDFYADRKPAKARAFYQQTVETQRRLVRLAPSEPRFLRQLALSHSNFGSFLAREGDLRPALAAHVKATELLEQQWRRGGDVACARDLAVAFNNLGMTQCALELLGEAKRSFGRALQIQERQVRPEAASPTDLSRLGGIHNNLGMILERQTRWSEAAARYSEAIQCQHRATELAPRVEQFQALAAQHMENHRRVEKRLHFQAL